MKKFIYIVAVLASFFAQAQGNLAPKQTIKQSLDEFIASISIINDPYEEVSPELIASSFMNGTYFRFNANDVKPAVFLQNYCHEQLGRNIITHDLKFTDQQITEQNDTWEVKAILKRASGGNEDFRVADTPISFRVRYNGDGNYVTILEINFNPALNIIRPQWKDEYVFDVTSPRRLRWNETKWSIAVDSKMRKAKYYGRDMAETEPYYPVPYTVEPDFKQVEHSDNQITVPIRSNTTRKEKEHLITITQKKLDGSTANEQVYVRQEAKPTVFVFDEYSAPMHQIDVIYSLKYNLGLSYMLTIPSSRIAVGAAVASNFNSFRGLFKKNNKQTQNTDISINTNINIGNNISSESEITNGYKKKVETIEQGDYSPLYDPYDDAEHYTSRSYFLAQGGVYILQWLRFDVGLGAARARDIHYMKDRFDITKYSYEPIDSDLPPIKDVYQYQRTGMDHYYRDKVKWSFAVRPAINGQIPLGGWNENFITVGVGYLFAPNLDKGNSVDFTLGYGINF